MQIEELKQAKQRLYQIAARHGISRVFDEGVSALGVGAFQYEAQQLLGIHIDVIPTFALQKVDDQDFVRSVQADAVAL